MIDVDSNIEVENLMNRRQIRDVQRRSNSLTVRDSRIGNSRCSEQRRRQIAVGVDIDEKCSISDPVFKLTNYTVVVSIVEDAEVTAINQSKTKITGEADVGIRESKGMVAARRTGWNKIDICLRVSYRLRDADRKR